MAPSLLIAAVCLLSACAAQAWDQTGARRELAYTGMLDLTPAGLQFLLLTLLAIAAAAFVIRLRARKALEKRDDGFDDHEY
jgi:hypothetical protein